MNNKSNIPGKRKSVNTKKKNKGKGETGRCFAIDLVLSSYY